MTLSIHSTRGRDGQHQTDSLVTDGQLDNSSSTRTKQTGSWMCVPLPFPPLPLEFKQCHHWHKTDGELGVCVLPSPLSHPLPQLWSGISPCLGRELGPPLPLPVRVGFSVAWPQRGFGPAVLTSGDCSLVYQSLLCYPVPLAAGLSCGPECSEYCHSLHCPRLHSLLSFRRMLGASRKCSSIWKIDVPCVHCPLCRLTIPPSSPAFVSSVLW